MDSSPPSTSAGDPGACDAAGALLVRIMAQPRLGSREFQIVLYGATGFTGQLAAKYLSKNYSSLRWAIGGRNEGKLQSLAESLAPAAPAVLVADGGDEEALERLAASTEVVVTTAGPFSRYGSKLVAACVKKGTNYCDITGEVEWVREMVATHDEEARRTGAHIVHLCGHDCVPWDLTTMMLAEKLREKDGEELVRVDFYDKIKASASGGTLETAMGILFGKKEKAAVLVASKFDPMVRLPSGAKSEYSVINKNIQTFDLSDPCRSFFVMADTNQIAVKRSNALLGYGRRVEYCEGMSATNGLEAVTSFLGLVCFGLLLVFPPTRFLLRKFVLPKPGQGPSEEEMLKSYLTLTGKAKGSRGSTVTAEMKFHVDPGYMDTARMLVESGLALVLDAAKIATSGGVYTPASCMGKVLLDRLVASGTSFSISEPQSG